MTQAGAANDRSPASPSSGQGGPAQKHKRAVNIAAAALRGLGHFYDMQAATTRTVLRTQMHAASAFGLPDYSRMFEIRDERALHLCSSAAERLAQLVSDTDRSPLTEIPSQICHLLEKQAIEATERWMSDLEELQHQTRQSMEELRELSRRHVAELASASKLPGEGGRETARETARETEWETTRQTMQEGGDRFRAAVRQGR